MWHVLINISPEMLKGPNVTLKYNPKCSPLLRAPQDVQDDSLVANDLHRHAQYEEVQAQVFPRE